MGFDENDGRPLVHLRKWGTKVNFAMVLGVIMFLGLGVIAICWMHSHRNQLQMKSSRRWRTNIEQNLAEADANNHAAANFHD